MSHLGHRLRMISGVVLILFALFSRVQEVRAYEMVERAEPRYFIESVLVRGNAKTSESVIAGALSIRPGEWISVRDRRFELSRYRVLSLGFFSDVRLRLRKGSRRGRVHVVVDVVERGTIVLTDIFLGTSEATDAWGGIGVAERNFLGRGLGLEGAFVIGTNPGVQGGSLQHSSWVRISAPRVAGIPIDVSASFLFLDGNEFERRSGPPSSSSPSDFLSTRYRRAGGGLSVEFPVATFSHLSLEYRAEWIKGDLTPGLVRRDPSGRAELIQIDLVDGRSFLSSIGLVFERDTRSDPVMPEAGALLRLTGEAATRLAGSDYAYVKASGLYRHYYRLPWRHILAPELFGGLVIGNAPFFEHFFIGDLNDLVPSRALGLNFSTLPSRDFFHTAIDRKRYEEIAIRTSMDYIIPWFRGGRFFYAGEFFLNAGFIFLASRDDLRFRDTSVSRSIPIDLTLNAGLRLDTYIGVFRVSIGNGLGRIPF